MVKNMLTASKIKNTGSEIAHSLSVSIRQLSFQTLKAIGSLKHNNDILDRASSNLADIVNKASLNAREKNTDNKDVEAPQTNERYKTELCRKFMENSSCPYGRKCQFSHGYHELRPVTRHPRYRTELCREFFNTGLCTYGTRCNFIHHCLSNQDTSNPPQTSIADISHSKSSNSYGVSTALRGYLDSQQCVDPSERPYTPNNDSGFSFGASNPSYTSTPLSIEDPVEFTRPSERSESPNDLYVIREEVVRGDCC